MADASVFAYTTANGATRYRLMFRVDGRQQSRSFTDKQSATYWLNVFKASGPKRGLEMLDAAETAPTSAPTMRQLVTDHVASLTGITQGSRDSYLREAERDIYPQLGDLPAGALTADLVRGWVNWLEHTRRLSGKTIANRHSLLSAAAGRAVAQGWLPENSCRGIRLPRTDTDEPMFLTERQVAELLEAIDPRYRGLLLVLVGTGVRWGEVTALQVRHVRLGDKPSVRVSQAWKDVDSGPMELGPPKSQRGKRTIPIPSPSPVLDALEFLRDDHPVVDLGLVGVAEQWSPVVFAYSECGECHQCGAESVCRSSWSRRRASRRGSERRADTAFRAITPLATAVLGARGVGNGPAPTVRGGAIVTSSSPAVPEHRPCPSQAQRRRLDDKHPADRAVALQAERGRRQRREKPCEDRAEQDEQGDAGREVQAGPSWSGALGHLVMLWHCRPLSVPLT